jgi:glycerophosphoryl diester phosphodiesterase
MSTDTLQLVAHRGIPDRFPENSLIGLEAAMRLGVPYVEFDVQATGDGALVLSHDSSLGRTGGIDRSLFKLSLAQLAHIDVGQRDRFGDRFCGTRIPTLAELITLALEYPQCQLLVELKADSLEHFGITPIIAPLMHQLHPVRDRCTIISFHLPTLIELRTRRSGYPLGWVVSRYSEAEHARALALEPELIVASRTLLKPTTPRWPGPWRWMIYSVDDPQLARAYAAAGVTLVETNDAERLLPALAQ